MKKQIRRVITFLFVMFLIISIVRMFFSVAKIESINSGDCFKGLFVDTAYSQLEFIFGNTDKGDSLCSVTYNKEYQIVVLNIGKYSNIDINEVSTVFKKSIPDFYFTIYQTIDISYDCKILKRDIFEEKNEIVLVLNANSKIGTEKDNVITFTSERFAIGYKQKKPHVIFDFNEKAKEVEFALTRINNRTFIVVLFAIGKGDIDGNILPVLLAH